MNTALQNGYAFGGQPKYWKHGIDHIARFDKMMETEIDFEYYIATLIYEHAQRQPRVPVFVNQVHVGFAPLIITN